MQLLRLHWGEWQGRRPDWVAAAVAGFLAGAVLMLLEGVWTLIMGYGDAWRTSRLLAAIVLGRGVLADAGFSLGVVALALLVHYVLGILFGLALAALVTEFHGEGRPGTMETIGAVFGMVLYLLNFHLMSHAFPWLVEMRGWATFMAHLIFGITAALLYWKLGRQGAQA